MTTNAKTKTAKTTKTPKTATTQTTPKYDLATLPTTSAKIRYLASQGLTRSEIVKVMSEHLGHSIRYQHVRNVLIQPLKRPAV